MLRQENAGDVVARFGIDHDKSNLALGPVAQLLE